MSEGSVRPGAWFAAGLTGTVPRRDDAAPLRTTHLEFTTGGPHEPPAPNPETLLVLYLGSDQAVAQARERVGGEPIEPANPYWQQHGVTLADPDGFGVVLVPESWPESLHRPSA